MKITLSTDSLAATRADLLAIGVDSKVKSDALGRLDRLVGGTLSRAMKDDGFKAKLGQVLRVPVKGRLRARWVALVGLGTDRGTAGARMLAVRAVQAARNFGSVAVVCPGDTAENVRAVAEGLVTGAYRYDTYMTGDRKPKGGVRTGAILVADKRAAGLDRALEQGVVVAENINLARSLVNDPPNDLHPTALAEAARRASKEAGVTCAVWGPKKIEQERMELILAVSRGTAQEPRVVHMSYKPAGAKARVVFVGKGLTFDSGGLCIKPPKPMADMKCDMAGAATTIGVVMSAARLKIPVEVHGIIGAVENMSGSNAYRPSDIFKSRDGKTVEIINTDAEGRLVLADVLSYAADLKPTFMIDHATLTGACMVALGPWTAGLFSNDDTLARKYAEAGAQAGESFWRLPLEADLRDGLRSNVADLQHTGDAHGGAITAALFLQEFIGKTKWAHCDIAGPAFLSSPHGTQPKGGTGFGIATGVRFLENLVAAKA